MAGVHGLQQVERLGSADFADDDALGSHTQAVADQFAHGDLAFAFDVRRTSFQSHHMRLLQLNLTSCSRVSLSFLTFRMVSAGPSIASARTMALTGEPSARRATQSGEDS